MALKTSHRQVMSDILWEHVMTHMRVMINNSASARRGLKAEVSARSRRYHDSTVNSPVTVGRRSAESALQKSA